MNMEGNALQMKELGETLHDEALAKANEDARRAAAEIRCNKENRTGETIFCARPKDVKSRASYSLAQNRSS